MKKTAIIYNSKTGFTEKYALWLAEETKAEAIRFKECTKKRVTEILREYDTIVFGSRLHAGLIEGLSKAKKMFDREGKRFVVFATGASPADAHETREILEKIWERNFSEEELGRIAHFYLQAGLCYERMSFVDKFMMKGFAAMLRKKKAEEGYEAEMAEAMARSFDISDRGFIMPLAEYLKG